uniref:Uncharacterized protein n=1 Tax=Nelumbo nucifera TaxID=4432 RepID=A0A822YF08_NELNU|nr:TPA_asm: hypothetical protein HUJ06_031297 [Nelumbo nucifera]
MKAKHMKASNDKNDVLPVNPAPPPKDCHPMTESSVLEKKHFIKGITHCLFQPSGVLGGID